MSKINNIIGLKKGVIEVLERLPNRGEYVLYLVQCSCGIKRSLTKKEILRPRNLFVYCRCNENKVGELRQHPLYDVWKGMKARCGNANHSSYRHYGGRGVTVCREWQNDFFAFYNWCLANEWKEGMHIDKDIKGDSLIYSPETCLIVTPVKNGRKTRRVKLTEDIAAEVRLSKESRKVLAQRFRVSKATIHQIKHNRIWKTI